MSSGWTLRAEALGADRAASRGERWLARRDGRSLPGFADLAAVPSWVGWPPAQQRRLRLAVALLHYRPQLDRELRSDVLAPLASLTGEAVFDRLCSARVSGAAAAGCLPRATRLDEEGRELVARSWPTQGSEAAYAAELTNAAAALLADEGTA